MDHIQEIVGKWHSIDAEIWAKIICLERNRRIAKAYARQNELVVNGSEIDYVDGATLGLNSFENPDRDARTNHIKQYIGQGIGIKICPDGDIFVRRLSKANVFVHWLGSNGRSNASEWPNGKLSGSKPSDRGLLSDAETLQLSQELIDDQLDSSEFYGIAAGGKNKKPATRHQQLVSARKPRASHKPQQRQVATSKSEIRLNKSLINSSSGISSSSSSSVGGVGSLAPAMALAGKRDQQQQQLNGGPIDACKRSQSIGLHQLVRVFDMEAFRSALEDESRRSTPDRLRLRNMCISVISFVLDDDKLLNLPSWILIINIVALDLLNSEIGLMDLHDYSQLLLQTDAEIDHDEDEMCNHRCVNNGDKYNQTDCGRQLDKFYNKFYSKTNNSKHQEHPKGQLEESKRAFANAAALGAYNGDFIQTTATPEPNLTKRREYLAQSRLLLDNKLDINQATTRLLPQKPPDLQQQSRLELVANKKQSSASSGFDSHCTSSANSSLATVTANSSLTAIATGQRANTEPSSAGAENCRGKRAPKLPHGLAATTKSIHSASFSCSDPTVSEPIPIPAPPTSKTTGPSGRANLILVSPTGLSPPTSKRRTTDASANSAAATKQASNRSHISAIPAHAQLAPPATQRHILRYLMSTVAPHQSSNGLLANDTNQAAQLAPGVARYRQKPFQRPLPVLPPASKQKLLLRDQQPPIAKALINGEGQVVAASRSVEESLYYCGLQARVPADSSRLFRLRNAPGPPPPPPKSRRPMISRAERQLADAQNHHRRLSRSTSAIDAILSQDYKLPSATTAANQKPPRDSRKQRLANNSCNRNQRKQSTSSFGKSSALEPMLKLFQRSSETQAKGDRKAKLSLATQTNQPSSAAKFMSLENLDRPMDHKSDSESDENSYRSQISWRTDASGHLKSSSSFMNYVGGFLKRSSNK